MHHCTALLGRSALAPLSLLQEQGAYPGPLTELNFWGERAANLNSIHDQLTGEKIQKVSRSGGQAVRAYCVAGWTGGGGRGSEGRRAGGGGPHCKGRFHAYE